MQLRPHRHAVSSVRPLATELTLAFRPVVLALAAIMLLSFTRFVAVAAIDTRITALLRADVALDDRHEHMLNQASAIRGWLLTGDRTLLQPYTEGVRATDAANAQVLSDLGGDPAVAPMLMAAWAAQQRWQNRWADLAVTGDGATRDPSQTAFIKLGEALFDDYRRANAAVSDLLHDRLRRNRARERTLFWGGVTVHTFIGTIAFAAVRRQRRNLQRSVTHPLQELLEAVRRVRAGEQVTPHVTGPMELRHIAEELAATTASLASERRRADHREMELARQANIAERVLELARDFTASLDIDAVGDRVTRGAVRLSGMAVGRLWLVDREKKVVVAAYTTGSATDLPGSAALGQGLVGKVVQHGRTLFASGTHVRSACDDPCTAIALPMIAGGEAVGVLELRPASPTMVAPADLQLLEMLATQAGTAVEAARLHRATEEMSRRDSLTGLLNRRQFDADLADECKRHARYGRQSTVAMLDLDHFKQLNDTYGHPVGDDVLRDLAAVLQAELRETDTAYRYGGEEFAVLLRETDAADAGLVVTRLLAAIEDRFVGRFDARSVTASSGVADVGVGRQSPEAVVRTADRALYDAKRSGRNRCIVAQSDPTTHSMASL